MFCKQLTFRGLVIFSLMSSLIYLGSTYYDRDARHPTAMEPDQSSYSINSLIEQFRKNTLSESASLQMSNIRSFLEKYRRPEVPEWSGMNTMSGISCKRLFEGDAAEQEKAINYTVPESASSIAKWELEQAGCSNFTRSRGYIMFPVNEEEEEYPIAFSLVVYTDFTLAERLLRAVYRPHNYYCIHVDLKSPDHYRRSWMELASCLPNVFLTSVSHAVKYKGITIVSADIQCMRELLAYKKWRYFINLTGHEFPLKTNWELVQILKTYNGSNDIDSFHQWSVDHSRDVRTSFRKTGKPRPPYNITPTCGYVHVVATRGYVNYVITSPIAKGFFDWVNGTEIPDETYFSSLHHRNSHLKVPGSFIGGDAELVAKPSMTRFKIWMDSPFGLQECPGSYFRNFICQLSIQMLPRLANTPKMFMNKVKTGFHPAAVNCLEQKLYRRIVGDYSGERRINTTFYENLSFVKNHI